MPWCAACQRFLSPPTVTPEGRCPACGRSVEPGQAHPPDDPPASQEEPGPVPLHLKVLGAAMVVYLGYRFFQGLEWLIHRF